MVVVLGKLFSVLSQSLVLHPFVSIRCSYQFLRCCPPSSSSLNGGFTSMVIVLPPKYTIFNCLFSTQNSFYSFLIFRSFVGWCFSFSLLLLLLSFFALHFSIGPIPHMCQDVRVTETRFGCTKRKEKKRG